MSTFLLLSQLSQRSNLLDNSSSTEDDQDIEIRPILKLEREKSDDKTNEVLEKKKENKKGKEKK